MCVFCVNKSRKIETESMTLIITSLSMLLTVIEHIYIYIYKPQYSCVQIPPQEESKYCKCLLQWLWLHLFVIHILYMQMQGWYVYICEEQESPTWLLGQKLWMERDFAPLTSNSDCNLSPYLYCKQTTDK